MTCPFLCCGEIARHALVNTIVSQPQSDHAPHSSNRHRAQMTSLRSAAALLAVLLPCVAHAAFQSIGCKSPTTGVLAKHNSYRTKHRVKPLVWNATLAKTAQSWANKCKFEHNQSGQNLYAGQGMVFPYNGMDICTWSTASFYSEVSSYNFASPSLSGIDGGMVGHFTQVVWGKTTQVGCGYAKCSPLANAFSGTSDYVVCNYSPPGNVVMGTSFQFFKDNVLRTSCQTASADDWCQACSGATCTRCFARASFGLMSNQPIRLDTKKCVSTCPAGKAASVNCAACLVSNRCLRCKAGFQKDSKGVCSVRQLGRR